MGIQSIQPLQRYRTIWISDIHLGTRGCKAELLLDFLKYSSAETVYLVGDIIDGWRLRKTSFWRQSHNDVMQRFLRMAAGGTKIYYIPGNHDEMVRPYCDVQFGNITICDEAIHETADGKRLLVMHGDQFDTVVRHARWLAVLGDHAYRFAMGVNYWMNLARKLVGLPYWSLSAYLKNVVKNAVEYIGRFEDTLADEARRRKVDGVVCGHIHHAQIREIDGILYCNDGDWVESCTALVEHFDGSLEIIYWAEETVVEWAMVS